jgi:hypothetical protein
MTAIGPGTRVKCVKRGHWVNHDTQVHYCGPTYGSVWTVTRIREGTGVIFACLAEWHNPGDGFNVEYFRPLDGDAEIERLRALIADKQKLTVVGV